MKNVRADRTGEHRAAFNRNARVILATQDVCALCGRPVDKSLSNPNPFAPNIDHIIPVARGGHPSSIDNLQLTHRCCNRRKGDKLVKEKPKDDQKLRAEVDNRNLPQTRDWTCFVSDA